MTYDFFADKTDKIKILDFIFSGTDLKIYDHSSPYGQEICEYKNVDEVISKFDLDNGSNFGIGFQLWTPRHKGQPLFRKIDLDPKRCNGHTFRYSTEGWGLIQLSFGGLKNNELNQSHIGHFSEKEALKWEEINTFNGQAKSWDWTEIQKTSRQLKLQIHKTATKSIGSFDVLEGAEQLQKIGITFR